MKTLLISALSILLCKLCFSQQVGLNEFNVKRQKINKKALLIIGGWSAGNIIYGSIASAQTQGSTKYFNQMNAIWNGVTLGIATIGYISAQKNANLSYAQSLKQQTSIEKAFLVNAGIDVAYIAGGLYIKERSKSPSGNPDRLKGYGESIILQGSVLLLFDAILYGVHNQHGKQLYRMAIKINIASTDNGVGIVVKL